MRSIVCRQFGPLDQLEVQESPSPDLFPGTVRIAVTACGVNYVDALFVQGKYQIKPPTPFVPGMEVVGTIAEMAPDVQGLSLGTRVFANVGLGGYASEAMAAAKRVIQLPDSLTDGQAATFMQSYLTAWFALVERAQVQPDRWLLVLGAGSGVGLAAVDVGRALGLHVIAVASTPEKRALAESRGAVAVIDSTLEANHVKEEANASLGAVSTTSTIPLAAKSVKPVCAPSPMMASISSLVSSLVFPIFQPIRSCCAIAASLASIGAAGPARTRDSMTAC